MAGNTIEAPKGAHWDYEEVKTAKGTQSLGEVPILVWDDLDSLKEYYGEDGLLAVCDGTSLRVSFQNIARRFKAAGKTDDEIAKAIVDFKPGKRAVGQATPTSRAKRLAGQAAEKVGNKDALEKLLEKIANGELSDADIEELAG